MGEENVEIVRSFYADWAAGRFPGPVDRMDPDIEYVNPSGAIERGTRHGVPAFTRAGEKLLDAWEYWWCEVEEFEVVEDRVAVLVHYRTRGRGSGAEVEGRESALWTLRDGKVIRYEWFHGTRDAFEAIALREEAQ